MVHQLKVLKKKNEVIKVQNSINNQVLNCLEKENQDDESLYKFRAITDHHRPLEKDDPIYNGSLYNVMVEWETEEVTDE